MTHTQQFNGFPRIEHNIRIRPFDHNSFGWVDGGLYHDDGRRLRGWHVLGSSRSMQLVPKRRISAMTEAYDVSDAIYGGVWFSHFGHFITETLPNLATICNELGPDDPRPIYFQSLSAHEDFNALPSYITYFLGLLGLDGQRFHLVNTPVAIENLYLPRPAFVKKYQYAPFVAEVLDKQLSLSKTTPDLDIYFSRGKLVNNVQRAGLEEAELETMFKRHGFTVVYPENMTIAEQLDLASRARVIAGLNGSALHWSLYARSVEKVMLLGWNLGLQRQICRLREQDYIHAGGAGMSRFLGRKKRRLPADYVERSLFK